MKLRGADILVRTLAAAGTKQVFTLSGNHVMPVFDAALDTKLPLLHVRHEAAAVHMADAWGRLTGEVGVAMVTGGPGHSNAVSALYTALAAESPVLLISGHAPLAEMGTGAFQEMDQVKVAAPLCKAAWAVQSLEGLGEDVARALREARTGRPGPVHLSVPNDILDASIEASIPSDFAPPDRTIDRKSAVALAETLGAAKRPLIITGPVMLTPRGRIAAKKLEEASGIPVFGMESPRGVADASLGRVAGVLARADCVLLLGKRKDFTLKFGKVFAADCKVLEAGADIDAVKSAELLASSFKPTKTWGDEVRAELRARKEPESKGDGLHAADVCKAVQKLLDSPDAILVADGGEYCQWAQALLKAPHRIVNGVAGSIGSALPFAAAAKLARPASTVVAMLGDGTFGFHMSEIETAVRLRLPYVAVVGSDACWNAEYQIQLRAYGKERAHGLDLLPVKYGAVAAAMGAFGADVSSFSELEKALEKARATGLPAVINVAVQRAAAPSY